MQEYNLAFYNSQDECLSRDWRFFSKFVEDCIAIGIKAEAGRELASILRHAGLEAVGEKVYRVPMCRDPSMPARYMLADLNGRNWEAANQAKVDKICASRR